MHAVFLDQQTFNQHIDLTLITQAVDKLSCYALTPQESIVERCQSAEVIITNKVVLTAEILKKLPQLKLICVAATGYNNIDVSAATALGITVCNVSGYSNESVSQYVFAQLLEYFSTISHHNQNTEKGLWQQSPTFCHLGKDVHELAGKTIGIIGYGNLGKTIEAIATAFSMKVLIAERQSSTTMRSGRVALEYVLEQADIISLHCPQTADTEKMVNREFLNKMKPSAILINTARGPVIDNHALLTALKNDDIAYAILDVLDCEPPTADHPLINTSLNNLKITAHIAWASVEAQQRLIALIAKNINAFSSKAAINVVN